MVAYSDIPEEVYHMYNCPRCNGLGCPSCGYKGVLEDLEEIKFWYGDDLEEFLEELYYKEGGGDGDEKKEMSV